MSRVAGPRSVFLRRVAILIAVAGLVSASGRAAGPAQPPELPETKVTMHLHGAAPSKVFAELARQEGVEIGAEPADLWKTHDKPVDIDVDGQPFWEAAKQVTAKTGLQIGRFEDKGFAAYADHDGDNLAGPSVLHDGFMTVVTDVFRAGTVEFGKGGAVHRELRVGIVTYPELKWRVLGASEYCLTEAVDDKGHALIDHAGSADVTPEPNWPIDRGIDLKYPENLGQKIARLKGSIQIRVVTKTERIEIPNVDNINGVRKSFGKCDLVFAGMKHDEGGAEFDLKIATTGEASDRGLDQFHEADVKLVWSNGKSTSRNGGMYEGNKGSITFGAPDPVDGEKPPTPARLVVDLPVETKTVTVAFEFKDLPIPQ